MILLLITQTNLNNNLNVVCREKSENLTNVNGDFSII